MEVKTIKLDYFRLLGIESITVPDLLTFMK